METPEQKEQLGKLVTTLYQECGVFVEPLWPKVLVRVLPREQQKGHIILPDNKQNKPTLEGVVLKTYKPFYQKIFLSEAQWVKDDPDPEARYVQKVECSLVSGDHVLFPHIEYGVVPVWPLDDGRGDYRMIPENIVVGKLEYYREKPLDWLEKLIERCKVTDGRRPAWLDEHHLAQHILQNADVVRKDLTSLTMSGV